MEIKRFSEISSMDLEAIINKHYQHWSMFNHTMDMSTTKEKFNNYALNDSQFLCYI